LQQQQHEPSGRKDKSNRVDPNIEIVALEREKMGRKRNDNGFVSKQLNRVLYNTHESRADGALNHSAKRIIKCITPSKLNVSKKLTAFM